jgi:hypothetical protein
VFYFNSIVVLLKIVILIPLAAVVVLAPSKVVVASNPIQIEENAESHLKKVCSTEFILIKDGVPLKAP